MNVVDQPDSYIVELRRTIRFEYTVVRLFRLQKKIGLVLIFNLVFFNNAME